MRHSLAVFLLLTLVACSSLPEEGDNRKNATAEELYTSAKSFLDDKSYDGAIKRYQKLQSRYPYGRYAQQAMLEMAYAYYKQGEPDPAISTADSFIKQFPNSEHIDYAFYLKGLANFNGDKGILSSIGGEETSDRDPQMSQDSYLAFKELITRYPESQYVPDATLRMQYLANQMARHELHVAQYYLRRGANIAAVNRAQGILNLYPNSPATREALLVMVRAYDAMGMTDLRDDAQRVLNLNGGSEAATAIAIARDKKSWWQFWK